MYQYSTAIMTRKLYQHVEHREKGCWHVSPMLQATVEALCGALRPFHVDRGSEIIRHWRTNAGLAIKSRRFQSTSSRVESQLQLRDTRMKEFLTVMHPP